MNPVNQCMEIDLLNQDEETANIFWTDAALVIWTDESGNAWTNQ